MKKNKAFTIIELMVVVVIIAILATIVLVTLESGKVKSRDAKRKADLSMFSGSLERYHADYKSYPSSTSGLWCTIGSDYSCFHPYLSVKFADYLSPVPTDPNGDTPGYKYKSDGNSYKIFIKSEGITDDEADSGDCSTSSIKQKAGDYCDPSDETNFQISSDNSAMNWQDQ